MTPSAGSVAALVINMDSDVDRWAAFQKNPGLGELTVMRVPGLRGSSLAGAIAQFIPGADMTQPGTFGCFASHVRAWEKVLEAGLEGAVVIEDNAELMRPLAPLLGAVLASGNDLVFLNARMTLSVPSPQATVQHQPEPAPEKFVPVRQAIADRPHKNKGVGADGYFITRSGAAKLLGVVSRFGVRFDLDWFLLFAGVGKSGLPSIAAEPRAHRILSQIGEFYDVGDPCFPASALAVAAIARRGDIPSVRIAENSASFQLQSVLNGMKLLAGQRLSCGEPSKAWIYRGHTVVLDFLVEHRPIAIEVHLAGDARSWWAEARARNAQAGSALLALGLKKTGPDSCFVGSFPVGVEGLPDMEAVVAACQAVFDKLVSSGRPAPAAVPMGVPLARPLADDVHSVSVVCIVDERELEMASLLARSLAQHLDRALFCEILFVHVGFGQPDFGYRFDVRVRPELADLNARSRLVSAADLGVPLSTPKGRQEVRMALKLQASRHVCSPYYLLLDAASHLVAPVNKGRLFAQDGRPQAEFAAAPGIMADRRRASFSFWGRSMDDQARAAAPNLMSTAAVTAMLAEMAQRSGLSAQALLAKDRLYSELLLYAGYLDARDGMDRVYAEGPRPVATLYANWPQKNEDVLRVVRSTRAKGAYALAIHEKRFEQLTPEQCRAVAEVWLSARLFDSIEAGLEFIARQVALFGPRNNAADAPDVVVGRSGRLCIGDGSNRLLAQHLGRHTLDDDAVERWRKTLKQRLAFCAEQNIDYGVLVAPDTFSIHAEDFSDLGPDSPTRPIGKLQAASVLEAGRIVYPLPALRAARSRGIVCHTADSHWTSFGAYIAYQELQRAMPQRLRRLTDLDVSLSHHAGDGDLGIKLHPKVRGEFTDCVLKQSGARRTWHNGINNRGWMGLWRHEDRGLPRAVLLMDSYGWKLQQFLAESFSSLFVVHSPFLERDLVESLRPDVVLNVMAERFLIRVPNDSAPELALATACKKLPGATYPSKQEFDAGRRDAAGAGG